MDKLKQWIALTLVGALGIMTVGWFLLVSPKRGEAAELRTQAVSQRSANIALETQIEMLKAQAQELPKEQATLAEVAGKIPDNPALPALVRALIEASTASGVQLVSITPGPPTVAAPAAPTAAAAPVNGQTTPGTTAAAPAASSLASIPVAVNVVGGYFQVAQFLAELESLPRALRVNNLAVTPGTSPTTPTVPADGAPAPVEDGSSLSATISGFVFMAAGGPAAASPTADAATTIAPAS